MAQVMVEPGPKNVTNPAPPATVMISAAMARTGVPEKQIPLRTIYKHVEPALPPWRQCFYTTSY